MTLKFEKLLTDNGMSENDTDFPSGAAAKMAKIRKYQADLETAEPAEKADILEKINKLDDELMEKLSDYFEVIDEEAEKEKAKEKAAADKAAADKAAKDKAAADKVAADKAAADKAAAEKKKKDDEASAKKKQEDEAAAAKKKQEDEAAAAKKKKEEEDDSKPATSNAGALEKLFKKGKTTVTKADLKAAGFDTGWLGPIGPNGCSCGEYRLHREDQFTTTFSISKR